MAFFKRLLDKSILFKGGRALPIRYCLTVRVNPSRKVSGFAGAIGKACIQTGPGNRGEVGHALGVEQAAGSKGSEIRTWLLS